MRVNLLMDNPEGVKPGYLNIDPYCMAVDKQNRSKGYLFPAKGLHNNQEVQDPGLGRFIHPGQASEIVAHDILTKIELIHEESFLEFVLSHWRKYLEFHDEVSQRGVLTLSFVDFTRVAHSVYLHSLSEVDAARLLYSQKSGLSGLRVKSVLESLQMKVLKFHYCDFVVHMEAVRES